MYGTNHYGRSVLLGHVLRGVGLGACHLLALVALTWSAQAAAVWKPLNTSDQTCWTNEAVSSVECYVAKKWGSGYQNCHVDAENLPGSVRVDCTKPNPYSKKEIWTYAHDCDNPQAPDYLCIPLDCSSEPNMIKDAVAGTPAPGSFVSPAGCEYEPIFDEDGRRDYWCDYQYGDGELVCTFKYKPTGNQGTPTTWGPGDSEPQDGTNESNPGDTFNDPPTVTEDDVGPPQTTPDTPNPGDTTTTQTQTETTETPGDTSVTNTTTTVEATQEGDYVKTKTTTTTTTTYADGTTTTVENVQNTVTKAPSTQTTVQGDGTAITTTTNPGYTVGGQQITTTTTNPDGSSNTTTSTTGDPDPQEEGEEEAEEDVPFDGPDTGEGLDDAEGAASDLWGRLNSAPIVAAVNGLGTVSNPSGSCSAFSLPTGWITGNPSTTLHCEVWDAVSPALSVVMLVAWSWMALVIFLRA